MDHVLLLLGQAVVAPHRAGGSGLFVVDERLSDEFSACLNHIVALPDHGEHGAFAGELDEPFEEWLVSMVLIMPFEMLFAGLAELEGYELEAPLLEFLYNVANLCPLHSIRLHHY